jgi:FKBP-type peptidyl-prolyl cis-trans isomerase SlyD
MSQEVKNGLVVGIHYTLKDSQGNILDKSADNQPLEYLHGRHNIIPGLEEALEGMKPGDKKHVVVSPEEAYGEYDENLAFSVPLKNFPAGMQIEPGMEFETDTENGHLVVTVVEVHADSVDVDGNHPLAGEELHFDVSISSIREATAQENEHGHVHHHGHDH